VTKHAKGNAHALQKSPQNIRMWSKGMQIAFFLGQKIIYVYLSVFKKNQ
jgi:hypothetical protein